MTLTTENCGYANFNKTGFNAFYVIMKGVPIIANFKPPIYQTFG